MIRDLHCLNASLDCILAPPYPQTDKDKAVWIPPQGTFVDYPAPVLEKWVPPKRILTSQFGGFWLAQHVLCFQRGYYPQRLFQDFLHVSEQCFKTKASAEGYALDRMAFDFFIAIVADGQQVVGGCVVEFRPSKLASVENVPYLYISTLCVSPSFGGKGLGHQIVHSVYTLGSLLLEQDQRATGIWQNALSNKKLCVGLTVAQTPYCDTAKRLVALYSQCGLSTHRDNKASYASFTPYSIYEWQIEYENGHIPMWQPVHSDVIYEDHQVCILSPSSKDGISMYHAFPIQFLQSVRLNGIIHSKHKCLHPSLNPQYTPSEIKFTQSVQIQHTHGVFQLKVRSTLNEFELRISIPAWFAEIESSVPVFA